MTHPRPFSALIASFVAIGLLFHPTAFSAAEQEKPHEPHAQPALADHARQDTAAANLRHCAGK